MKTPRYIQQSDGSILFRSAPPKDFVFKNYAPVPGNPLQYRPIFAKQCEYRKVEEVCSPCGKHVLGYDYKCDLDGIGVSCSICNACDPLVKAARVIGPTALELVPLNIKKDEEGRHKLKGINDAKPKRSPETESTQQVGFNQESRCEIGKGESLLGKESTN